VAIKIEPEEPFAVESPDRIDTPPDDPVFVADPRSTDPEVPSGEAPDKITTEPPVPEPAALPAAIDTEPPVDCPTPAETNN
jgi:hypothetical protein